MKAVILAGGEGTRLRPLTHRIPKPMVRLLGRPALEYTLELLARSGVDEARLTLAYRPEVVTEHFRSGSFAGVRLQFVNEVRPLGTAGGVRNAAEGFTDDFLVISGDALTDIDLAAAMAFHRAKGAEATVITHSVSDPREYGLADIDADGRVRGFLEKPDWAHAFSDLANTGIYILSPACLERISAAAKSDFAQDVFPRIVADGGLYAFTAEGYWRDIGDVGSYLAAQRDMLAQKVNVHIHAQKIGGSWFADEKPESACVLEAPCYIGKNVRIGDGAVIGGGSVIDDGVVIGARARTAGCVALPNAVIGESSLTRNCLLCDGVFVGRHATVAGGAVIGPDTMLGNDAVVGERVVLQANEAVPDEAIVVRDAVGRAGLPKLTDGGIAGRLGSCITAQFCVRLGELLAAHLNGPVCVADDGLTVSYIHRTALVTGVLSGGGQVYDTGVMFGGQLAFAVAESGAEAGALVSGYGQGITLMYRKNPPPKSLLADLEKLCGESFAPQEHPVWRVSETMSGLGALWENRLLSALKDGQMDFSAAVYCKNQGIAELTARLFAALGGRSGSQYSLNISPDGSSASLSRGGEILADDGQLCCVCATAEFERGNDVVIGSDAPRVLESIAKEYGRRVFRRPSGPETSLFALDGVSLLLCALACTGTPAVLENYLARLPSFGTFSESVPTTKEQSSAVFLGKALRTDGAVRTDSGVSVPSERGWVTLRPSSDGRFLRVCAEAVSVEAARELCLDFEDLLRLPRRDPDPRPN